MLKITGDGRKAALDMRLVDPFADTNGDTKVGRAVDRIPAVWEATHDQRSTQLVFCDLSTPDPARFNVYEEVRSRLIASGIPKGEIAFIHDADTDVAKMELFNAVNAGRVRILIGSTEKIGAGTKRSAACGPCIISTRPGARGISNSGMAESSARVISIPKSTSIPTSPRARSMPICGRPWKSSSR